LLVIVKKFLSYISDGSEFNQRASLKEYKILKELGRGGFGKVMLAQHKISKCLKAIKIVDANKLNNTNKKIF